MTVVALRNYSSPKLSGSNSRVRTDITDDEALYLLNHYYPKSGMNHNKFRFEKQWYINLCYYMGLQGGSMTSFLAGLDDRSPAPWIKKHVVNHIVPIVTRTVSKLTSQPPRWSVLPKSPDMVDQTGAKVSEKYLQHCEHELDLGNLRQEIALWKVLCGTCLARVDWDPWAKGMRKVYIDPRTQQELDPKWLSSPQGMKAREWLDQNRSFKGSGVGGLAVKACSPFSIFVPNYASTRTRAPWMMEVDTIPMEDMYNQFDPERCDKVTPEQDRTIHGSFARRLKGLVARYGFGNSLETREYEEVTTLRTLWIPPSELLPMGRKIVGTGSVILENVDHPFADMGIRFPYAKFDFLPVPGRWWGMSLVELLVDSQRELNKQRSMMMEDIQYMGRPKWINPKGNGLNVITDDVGEFIEFDRMVGPPVQVDVKVNPQMHEVGIQQTFGDMQMLAAQQDVSMARTQQGGAKSGVAISLLQEQDDRAIAPAVRSFERGMQVVGKMMLRLAARHETEPRLIGLTGEGKMQDAMIFLGRDLRENDNAVVIPGSMAPRSKAAEMEKIQGMLAVPNLVNLANPMERRLVFRALEVGDSDEMWIGYLAQCRRARQENEMFLRPTPGRGSPVVQEFDDDDAHLESHIAALCGDDFEYLDVFQQEVFKAHVRKHQERKMQAMQMQMMMEAATRGGPGEKGQASQPRQSQPTPGQKPKQDAA